ncbi:MAG: flavin reductase [Acidobacteria bacterium]|nr:flavin reductase [Acidobacteriota bacterium]
MTQQTPEPLPAPTPGELFRSAFRQHAAGVAIITASHENLPFGFTATSLASLSAVPPRFTFNMAITSHSWPAVKSAEYIGVHMLGNAHRDLADSFARSKDRFNDAVWATGDFGVPVIAGVTGWLVGRVEARYVFDNNAVIVAQVVGGGNGPVDAGPENAGPLLYHSGQYARPASLDYFG